MRVVTIDVDACDHQNIIKWHLFEKTDPTLSDKIIN